MGFFMYDLIAIGNALVDTEFELDDEILSKTGLTRGNMTLANKDVQHALFEKLSSHQVYFAKKTGGGSAANTMCAFAALGGSAYYHCCVGDDELGRFYLADLAEFGVKTSADKATICGVTGSCAVLVTPDGERTMQTYLGASSEIGVQNIDFDVLKGAKILYLEGYLAMNEALSPTICQLIDTAKANQVKIAVSFADPAVVTFAKQGLLNWLNLGVDMIFCNLDEAKIFAENENNEQAVQTLLDYANLAVVTNGKNPTYIAQKSSINITIEQFAVPAATMVVDTNGAGDNFAGAFLYGLNLGLDLPKCVTLAGLVASQVVAKFGARLNKGDYLTIKDDMIKVLK